MAIEQALRSVKKSIEWLLYTREELNLRERDRRIHALLDRDTITSREFLEADFGTKNPNGLDVKNYPEHTSRVRPLTAQDGFDQLSLREKMKELSMAHGRAGVDDRIYLHPAMYDPAYRRQAVRQISNTFSHEHIHRLQGGERDTGWRLSSFSNSSMMFLYTPPAGSDLIGKALGLYQSFNRAVLDWQTEMKTKYYDISSYFAREVEIQARLHEVLVQGYAGWQKMPVNRVEFWAALHNMGMKTPAAIMAELRASEDGQRALKDFRASPVLRRTVSSDIRDINRVADYAVFDHKHEIFWRQALPAMYGNLLELYGDGPGRARMVLGTNPAPAIAVLREIGKKPAVVIDSSQAAAMAETIDPEHANGFIYSLSQMLAEKPDPVRESSAVAVTEALLTRPGIVASLSRDRDVRIEPAPAFFMAVRSGNEAMIECLLQAGVNPLTANRNAGLSPDGFHLMNLAVWLRDYNAASKDMAAISGLDAPRAVRKSIIAIFNDAVRKEVVEQDLERTRRGLIALGRYCPDIDFKSSFTRPDGSRVEASVRSLLEVAGIDPPQPAVQNLPRSAISSHIHA